MDWIVLALIAVFVLGFFLLNRSQLVSESDAQRWLREGAKIIDVRTEAEYRHNPLPGSINLPLPQLRDKISKHVEDKNQVLLLHCAAGGRSALARRTLRELGYSRSYNLGSHTRAARIVAAATQTASDGPV